MDISQSEFEKLGAFYLGKEWDYPSRKVSEELVLYDSKDLVTHGVVLGMTGSGKTGLCMSLLEEAGMDNIPAIVIDPKGDIANLMLSFPEFRGEDFRPWVSEEDALRKGENVGEYAEGVATMWKEGLEQWGQSADRVRYFKENVNVTIFTPGSQAGVPVSLLGDLSPPAHEVIDDGELYAEYVESTVSSLLALAGLDVDEAQSPESVLLGKLFTHYWERGMSLSLEGVIRAILSPPFDKIGVIDLDSYCSGKKRQELAVRFNNLLASPSFGAWMEGPSMDIDRFLYQSDGRARISIFSIAHLDDSERMFFVSLLLNKMLSWMRRQSGTTSLRALLYMDEIYGYLPPTANPASKKPLMTILKQGRAFGLGALLATQNPVDLDYKALSNIGTWWLGRLQTERDKMRVLDGLQGASSAGGGFDRAQMEELLSGLGKRVFLMHNVHASGPLLFHVRWVMHYLCGPLTRRQIQSLMDAKRECWNEVKREMRLPKGKAISASLELPPHVESGVDCYFSGGGQYSPYLIRQAKVYFHHRKSGAEGERVLRVINPIGEDGIDWESELDVPPQEFAKEPEAGGTFEPLPGYAMSRSNYQTLEKDWEEQIYRSERAVVLYAPLLDSYSDIGAQEGAFRGSLVHRAREERDMAIEKLQEKIDVKLRSKSGQLSRAIATLDRERAQAQSAKIDAGSRVLDTLFGALLGSKRRGGSLRGGAASARSASRAIQQQRDVERAEVKVVEVEEAMRELREDLRMDIEALERKFDPAALEVEVVTVKPYKKDIHIELVGLGWIGTEDFGSS
ncbi:ATP-binding protein [Rubritalea tangerina]|uniref:ATP-binding protein n=1 Tax=Rubritalea tangerina TaxID=430798 RepID=A0ABW4Z8B6_9BACT